MKNKIFTKMVLVSALSANLVFATGIPVVDGAMNAQTMQHNLQQVAEWLKEANRWVETTQHYSSQLDHYAKEIAIQTGVRDVVSFLKDVKSVYDEADKLGTNLMELDFRKDSKSAWSDKVKKLMKQIYDY
ncbi:MAG: transport associated protein 4, partial [Campylobacter sp.]|nr:transport associated protein 4 [Campylobacter sp.]